MKILLFVVGSVAAIYGVAQVLQLLGVFGIGFSIGGIAIAAAAFAISAFCFQKALKSNTKT